MANTYPCNECGEQMQFIRDAESDWRQEGGKIVGSVASAFYECSRHGLKRVYIGGQIVNYRPKHEPEEKAAPSENQERPEKVVVAETGS